MQSIILGLVAAAVFGTIGALFGPQMLALMGASDDVLRTGSTFSRVMLGGSGTVVMLFLINAVFRGAGDAAIAMRVLWFANAINIILGPVPDLRPRTVPRARRRRAPRSARRSGAAAACSISCIT